MPVGGKRPGAGRPKGARSLKTKRLAEAVAKSGLSSLAYLQSVYQDPGASRAERVDAAGRCLPYEHSRLPQAMVIDATVNADLSQPANRLASKLSRLAAGQGTGDVPGEPRSRGGDAS